MEISAGDKVKYEWDEKLERLRVDRFLFSAVYLPFNYGFIIGKRQKDGDPADVVIYSSSPIASGAIVRVKIIGLLAMVDEAGYDDKFIAVPAKNIDPQWSKLSDIGEVPQSLKKQTRSFFKNYKELEPKKWVKVKSFHGLKRVCREWKKLKSE